MLLLIDNYDSFTYNIAQYFEQLGQTVTVWQNDAMTLSDIQALNPQYIVIGPGPCTPDEAGLSLAIIQTFGGQIPILGVCLGHQAIGQVFGAQVVSANAVMHGRVSAVHHQSQGIFADLPSPFNATRYHSLALAAASLPDCLTLTAWTQCRDGRVDTVMGIKHKTLPIEGVQFHPESILSEYGLELFKHFLQCYASL